MNHCSFHHCLTAEMSERSHELLYIVAIGEKKYEWQRPSVKLIPLSEIESANIRTSQTGSARARTLLTLRRNEAGEVVDRTAAATTTAGSRVRINSRVAQKNQC